MSCRNSEHALHIYGTHLAERENRLGDKTDIQNDFDRQ